MRIRYIPAFVTLTAGAITCIISIINQFNVIYSLKVLLIVLLAFYILGQIAQKVIVFAINTCGQKKVIEDELQNANENQENEEAVDNDSEEV